MEHTEQSNLENEPHSDIEIPEHIEITEEQRRKSHEIITQEYDAIDRIDDAYIDKESSSGKKVLVVKVNKGNVGSGAIENVYPLD